MIDSKSRDIEVLIKGRLMEHYIKFTLGMFLPILTSVLLLIIYQVLRCIHHRNIGAVPLLIFGGIIGFNIWLILIQARKKRSITFLLNRRPLKIDLLGLDKLRKFRLAHLERVPTSEKDLNIITKPKYHAVFTNGGKRICFVFRW